MARPFRLLVSIVFGVALVLGAVPSADAKVVVQEKVTYYPISGRTGIDLGKAMVQGGARAINMRHAIAATATRFDFLNPKLAVENGRCVVKDVTVKLTITYHYPKWGNPGGASGRLRQAWKSFYAELLRHERTHGRIARKYAGRVENELKRMSGTVAFGCRDFGGWSQARMKAISAQLKNEQAAFDTREDRRNSKITRLQVVLLKSQ